MDINGFQLVNLSKVNRVIQGDTGEHGELKGGLGEEKAKEHPELVLAYYDRLGGLVTKDGNKVKMGAFWDFVKQVPRETPKVTFEYRTEDGATYQFESDEPMEVKADKISKAKRKAKKVKKDDVDEES